MNILVPTVLDPKLAIVAFLNKFGTYGITIVWVIFCCILRLDGKPVLNFKAVAAKHINWGVLMLVIIAIMMSNALTDEVTGIKPLIMNTVGPILSGHGQLGAACILIVSVS